MKKLLLLFTLTGFTGFTFSQVTSGLVAKYSFTGGAANDEVGSNNGTLSGGTPSADRFGNSNDAISLNGSSDFVDLGASATLKPVMGTVSVWINTNGVSSSGTGVAYNPVIIAKNTSTVDSYFEGYALCLMMGDSKIISMTTDFGTVTEKYVFSDNALVIGSWYHLAMTYDNDSLRFYVNGSLNNSLYKGFASLFSASAPVLIGNSGNAANNRYFFGAVDDVRIYNRVLSAVEVDSLYNEPDPALAGLGADVHKPKLGIYPNPAGSSVNIHLDAPGEIAITNVYGQVVLQRSMGQSETISVVSFETGIYFVKDLRSGATSRFVKE